MNIAIFRTNPATEHDGYVIVSVNVWGNESDAFSPDKIGFQNAQHLEDLYLAYQKRMQTLYPDKGQAYSCSLPRGVRSPNGWAKRYETLPKFYFPAKERA